MDFLDFIRKIHEERKARGLVIKGGEGSGWYAPPKGTHTDESAKGSTDAIKDQKGIIRRERRLIDEDKSGASWDKYRAAQKKLAQTLLGQAGKPFVRTDKGTLALLDKKDFPTKTTIAVGKYRIMIQGKRGQETTVFTTTSFQDLRRSQMPEYIANFIY